MKKYSLALLAAVVFLPLGAKACDDCDCGCPNPPPVHFKDGIPSNGPVTGNPGYGDAAAYGCTFGFRDYGPARVVTPPPPAPDTKDMKPRPSS
jgi:hypothetical protein